MPSRPRAIRAKRTSAEPEGKPSPQNAVFAFLERHATILAIALVLLASIRIVATYFAFSNVSDETGHIVCGLEWLDRGTYTWEAQHPPLARVAMAAGPYLLGRRSPPPQPGNNLALFRAGLLVLGPLPEYRKVLASARLGILPFFWVACAVVYVWALWDFGRVVALFALLFFTFLPPILAHAGLATTDMALAAFTGASFLASRVWFEHPGKLSGLCFGVCTGLAVLSKLSSLVFLPAAWILALIAYGMLHRPRLAEIVRQAVRRSPSFFLALVAGFLVVWAGYRFTFGKVSFANIALPMPEMFAGIKEVSDHNAAGHGSYVLGRLSMKGVWYFFPVAIFFKTPLGLLMTLPVAAALACDRRRQLARLWIPAAFFAAILAVGMASSINIGVRHVLPVYISLSIAAGAAVAVGVERWSRGGLLRYLLIACAAWTCCSSLAAGNQYLAYFNEAAGSRPDEILVDSDLDWGQDLLRAGIRLRELHADHVAMTPFFPLDPEQFGYPPITPSNPSVPSAGWNAVSYTVMRKGGYQWTDRFDPTEKVGRSILLYYFKPGDPALDPNPDMRTVLRELYRQK